MTKAGYRSSGSKLSADPSMFAGQRGHLTSLFASISSRSCLYAPRIADSGKERERNQLLAMAGFSCANCLVGLDSGLECAASGHEAQGPRQLETGSSQLPRMSLFDGFQAIDSAALPRCILQLST